VQRGSPSHVMNNWICWGSDKVMSRQESALKHFEKSSTVPVRWSMASSPMGLFVRGGPKRAFTSYTNW
jgi:hypothetical protein